MNLLEVASLANKYGSNQEYMIAGGGNVSCKNREHLFINGSGLSLVDIDENGFVKMDREKLSAIRNKTYSGDTNEAKKALLDDIMDARWKGEYIKIPSIDVLLHDLFPQKYVLHIHPSVVNGITCAKEGESAIKSIFNDKAVWIETLKPENILAIDTRKAIEDFQERFGKIPGLIFLRNNGVLFAADTTEEIDDLVDEVITKIICVVNRKPDLSESDYDIDGASAIAPAIRMLIMSCKTSIATFRTNLEVKRLVASNMAFTPLTSAFTPHHCMHCLYGPLFIKRCEDIESQYTAIENGISGYVERNSQKPKIIAIEGLGFYACGKDKREADNAASIFLDEVKISVYAESFGGLKSMDNTVNFIENEEVETNYWKFNLGETCCKRATEKIAIVTGGAQGFGKGIVERLLDEGANVVIADLNEVGAIEVSSQLSKQYGKGKCIAVKVDVADEDSIKSMISRTVLEYGGLDIFINNAGINKPGGLEDIDVKTFELINKVNYMAYFLGAKYSARPMRIQHRYDQEYYMDIIQINSKSGISGSNKNFAYSGSKFAGIGLTQSFALELVNYNIKVNSICPGNLFEGPLWSDPIKGMFIQYLNNGKVPGAKTIDDVKRFYESKVPMARGCRASDVANAVLYLIEQVYETGQALPVTGGQLMLA